MKRWSSNPASSSVQRAITRSRCSISRAIVAASSEIRRLWWVLVPLIVVVPPCSLTLCRIVSTPVARSRCSQRSASTSPRRAPVTSRSRRACPSPGPRPTRRRRCGRPPRTWAGAGSGAGSRGFCAASIGLNATQPQRTAAEKALLSTAWHWRIDEAASGRHTCGAHRSSHSCGRGVRCSTNGLPRAAAPAGPQLGVELLVRARAELGQRRQRLVAERGQDELVDQQGVAGAGARLDLVAGQPLGQQHPQRDVRADRGVVGDLLAEAVAHRDRVVLGRGRAGEDQLLAGGRVDAAEDPHLEPRAALADAASGRLPCASVGPWPGR